MGRTRFGVDCWGLVRLVYADALRIELPSYVGSYLSVEERGEIAGLMLEGSRRWPWTLVPRAMRERAYDVALFRRGAIAAHVGIVIGAGRMLHIERERESCIASYADGPYRHRLIEIYRHAEIG
jgi:cell wall-associated NlpC family hydrolase